jgi:hypothetical protein
MSRKLAKPKTARVTQKELASGLDNTLECKYRKVLDAAKRKWAREFGGKKDPSDASVSVRISDAPGRPARKASRVKRKK